jgi:hypothetical protein
MKKHNWLKDELGYHCSKCGYKRTFNPNIDYTGFSVPFPLTGYSKMELNESLYGECPINENQT